MIFLPPFIMINEYFDKKRGKATALVLLGRGVGALAFSPFISYLFQEYQFSGGMVIFAGISLNICVAGALFSPLHPRGQKTPKIVNQTKFSDKNDSEVMMQNGEDPECHKTTNQEDNKDIGQLNSPDHEESIQSTHNTEHDKAKRVSIFINMKSRTSPSVLSRICLVFHLNLFKNVGFCAYVLLVFALSLNLSTVGVCIASILKEANFTQAQIALLISLMMGGVSLISRPISGIILDLKVVRLHRKFSIGITSFAMSICTLLAPTASSTVAIFTIWLCNGFLSSAFTTQEQIILPDIVGVSRQPSALGLSAVFRGIGILIGPTLGGNSFRLM